MAAAHLGTPNQRRCDTAVPDAVDGNRGLAQVNALQWARSLRKSRWMTQLGHGLQHVPITRIAAVGAHDAATHAIDRDNPSEYAPDAPLGLVRIARPFQGLAHRMAADWARTQDMNVFDMLTLGVRYFDLRLSPRGSTGELWISHGLYSTPLHRVVEHVAKFYGRLLRFDSVTSTYIGLGEGPPAFPFMTNLEVIVLDFQKLSGVASGSGTARLTQQFVRVMEPLRDLLPKDGEHLGSPLGDLWRSGTRIFVIYPCEIAAAVYAPAFLPRTPQSIRSHWFNCATLKPLLDHLRGELLHRARLPRPAVQDGDATADAGGQLHVLQAILSPVNSNFAHHLLNPLPGTARGISDFADAVNAQAITLFSRHVAADQYCAGDDDATPHRHDCRNVIMLDFFDRGRDEVTGLDAVELCAWINFNNHCDPSSVQRDAFPPPLLLEERDGGGCSSALELEEADRPAACRGGTPPAGWPPRPSS